jgi:hypothetical protein
VDFERDGYGSDGVDRSVWEDGGAAAAKGARGASCAICTHFGNHVLHASWRLVRVAVCDNFSRSATHALRASHEIRQESRSILMNQEFEQEYGSLSKKVRELREYL